jgi:hypothetical protein
MVSHGPISGHFSRASTEFLATSRLPRRHWSSRRPASASGQRAPQVSRTRKTIGGAIDRIPRARVERIAQESEQSCRILAVKPWARQAEAPACRRNWIWCSTASHGREPQKRLPAPSATYSRSASAGTRRLSTAPAHALLRCLRRGECAVRRRSDIHQALGVEVALHRLRSPGRMDPYPPGALASARSRWSPWSNPRRSPGASTLRQSGRGSIHSRYRGAGRRRADRPRPSPPARQSPPGCDLAHSDRIAARDRRRRRRW